MGSCLEQRRQRGGPFGPQDVTREVEVLYAAEEVRGSEGVHKRPRPRGTDGVESQLQDAQGTGAAVGAPAAAIAGNTR